MRIHLICIWEVDAPANCGANFCCYAALRRRPFILSVLERTQNASVTPRYCPAYTQFSTSSPSTRINSPVLFVTSTSPWLRAWAAR